MIRRQMALRLGLAAALAVVPARAHVADSGAAGFTIVQTYEIAATPACMASGALTFSLAKNERGTTLTLHYQSWGYEAGGLDKIAPAVDQVLAEQMERLKALIETGKPAP